MPGRLPQPDGGTLQTVPTLKFDDGSALTNPSIVKVKEHLAAIAA
jgi:mycoredoxin